MQQQRTCILQADQYLIHWALTEFNEEVAMEFMTIFDEGEASVWGLRVVATEEIVGS